MKVTTWNNGTFKESGAGYGIRIPKDCIESYFNRDWKSVTLHIEDTSVEIKLNSTFWTTCNELRSYKLGMYLRDQDMGTWSKEQPHKLKLIGCCEGEFRLER